MHLLFRALGWVQWNSNHDKISEIIHNHASFYFTFAFVIKIAKERCYCSATWEFKSAGGCKNVPTIYFRNDFRWQNIFKNNRTLRFLFIFEHHFKSVAKLARTSVQSLCKNVISGTSLFSAPGLKVSFLILCNVLFTVHSLHFLLSCYITSLSNQPSVTLSAMVFMWRSKHDACVKPWIFTWDD